MKNEELMKDILRETLPDLPPAAREKLEAYYGLLLEGNARMNLTRVTAPREVAEKHFADSLAAIPFLPQNANCIDIGAGAGFPGIPLLIARPDLKLTMLDSLQKRVVFLRETCAALGLFATCIHARAEDVGQDLSHRERYDIALARAVAPLNVLLELCAPFVKLGGHCIAYKGRQAAEEAAGSARAADVLGLSLTLREVPAGYGERALVIAEKRRHTPGQYPRKAGIPGKNPL